MCFKQVYIYLQIQSKMKKYLTIDTYLENHLQSSSFEHTVLTELSFHTEETIRIFNKLSK